MPYPKQPGTGGGEADLSKTLLKTDNLQSVADKAAARLNLEALWKPDNDGIEGWAALKARAPAYTGEVVRLKYYNKKATGTLPDTYRGGGLFRGFKATRADDGGYTCSSGGNYYWERIVPNIADLTVDDFGAVGDGVTDDAPAFVRMYDFMNSTLAVNLSGDNGRRQGIVVTAQNYALSDMDFSKREAAGSTSSGYKGSAEFVIRSQVPVFMGNHAAATLTPLGSDTKPLILANHARVTFHGIKIVDAKNKTFFNANRDTSTFMLSGCTLQNPNATAPSKKPFFKNVYDGGQYFNASCILIQYTGGKVFDLKDTIGSRVTELNSYMTAELVIDTGWSNQAERSWDHPTDFELSRCNFQYPLSQPFRFARMCQMVINNVWVEHGAAPGDLNNAQAVINAFSVEDCKTQVLGWAGRFIFLQNSLPTGNYVDMVTAPFNADGSQNTAWTSYYTNPDVAANADGTTTAVGSNITQWQSNYEMGWSRLEAAYTLLKNAVTLNYLTGALHGDNLAGSARWVRVGQMETRNQGGEWHFTIEGTKGFNIIKTSASANYPDNRASGKCHISIQRPADTGVANTFNPYNSNMDFENQTAVADAVVITTSATICELWVQLTAQCGGYSVHVTGSGSTRKEQGVCDRFVPGDGVFTTTTPAATGTQVLTRPERMWFKGDGTVAWGFNGGMLSMTTVQLTDAEAAKLYTTSPARYHWVMINGYKQPAPLYYGYIPVYTTNLANTATVATGGTLTLTVAATDAYSWQWYKGGVAISGATGATYTKANVTSADAGSYYAVAIGRPAANTKQSNTVTVTIT
ncbi:hypothetical protein [Leclercia sp.]|uniref:hypothetical protein n=1 Tax=Leclercia sp. TaxID=1898428 RepID=UPI0028A830F1|nr:hypothetical protein [Leclercia sp.]